MPEKTNEDYRKEIGDSLPLGFRYLETSEKLVPVIGLVSCEALSEPFYQCDVFYKPISRLFITFLEDE